MYLCCRWHGGFAWLTLLTWAFCMVDIVDIGVLYCRHGGFALLIWAFCIVDIVDIGVLYCWHGHFAWLTLFTLLTWPFCVVAIFCERDEQTWMQLIFRVVSDRPKSFVFCQTGMKWLSVAKKILFSLGKPPWCYIMLSFTFFWTVLQDWSSVWKSGGRRNPNIFELLNSRLAQRDRGEILVQRLEMLPIYADQDHDPDPDQYISNEI